MGPLTRFAMHMAIGIGILACLFMAVELAMPVEVEPLPKKIYIVQPGDTLGSIAERFLGSSSRYKELAELNNITDPHLIHPGQQIRFFVASGLSYREAVDIGKRVLTEQVVRFRNPHYKSIVQAREAFNVNAKYLSKATIDEGVAFRYDFEERAHNMRLAVESYDAWNVVTLLPHCILEVLPDDFTAEEYLDQLFKTMAVIEQETGYKNVRGMHTELGWYQVKPSTFDHYFELLTKRYEDAHKLYPPGPGLVNSKTLEESFVFATRFSNRLMQYYEETDGSFQKALERYNGGSKKVEYARRALNRYTLFHKRATELRGLL